MTSEKWSYRDLDNLLAGLEQDILDLDDRQLEDAHRAVLRKRSERPGCRSDRSAVPRCR